MSLRGHRLDVASIGALLHHRPRAVLRQNQRPARSADEHVLAGCVDGRIDVDPRQPHSLLRLRDIHRTVDRAAKRSVLETQQIGEHTIRNHDRRGFELDVAEHLPRLHHNVRSRADAAADHVVEVHVRVEDDGLQVHIQLVVQTRGIGENLLPLRQRQRLELGRKVGVGESERGGEWAAIRKVANLAYVGDAFDRLLVKFVRVGNRLFPQRLQVERVAEVVEAIALRLPSRVGSEHVAVVRPHQRDRPDDVHAERIEDAADLHDLVASPADDDVELNLADVGDGRRRVEISC